MHDHADRQFVLAAEQWDAFIFGLEQPPRFVPQLAKLFSEPSLLNES